MPALDDPQTRAALAALRVGALRWLGGGVVAVVLGALLTVAAVRIARDSGEPLPGVGLAVVALVFGGLAAAVVGLGSLLRARRWTAALSGTSWRLGRLRVAGAAALAIEPLGFDELSDVPLRVQLLSTAVWRTRAVQRLAEATVSYAPVSAREWVLTADGAGTVFGARTAGRKR
ncbi:hypothetical protein SAMN05661080_00959 [Modestobacter sp. DSM 44400]|uniref:hypothetical protein n=1 Tax=Modestobacter sp. DSM 44400 TaxID=1550230 RepID=UPI00089C447E|nr:hypothetical protein [Modestobacter sp. DSM 44400]SDX72117.1 hypothetical protein SAMN05661080_00959 [Modestobacter sp. DSM 44400]